MASKIAGIQQAILDYVDAQMAQPVYEQGIPDPETVIRNEAGEIDPYVAIRFGDLQQGVARAMCGPRGDDYILPIYFDCIGPTPALARGVQNKIMDIFLGEGFPWAGNVRKRPGGGLFSITNSNAATEAYSFPASFGLLVQFE